MAHRLAEMGYWIGRPYWNQGYCTEAAKEVLSYAFEVLGLNRVQARHMAKNPASGCVLQKVAMTYEGTLRQALFRWGKFEDVAIYAILRDEYDVASVHSGQRLEGIQQPTLPADPTPRIGVNLGKSPRFLSRKGHVKLAQKFIS